MGGRAAPATVERQRPARAAVKATSVTLAYVGSHGDRLQRQRDTNPVTPRTLADGTVVYGTRNGAQTISESPRQSAVRSLISANTYAESDYHSFQAALNRRLSPTSSRRSRTRCRAAATRRRATRSSKAAPPATNPYNEGYDYGTCEIDRTHNLRASAIYQLPFTANEFVSGWQVSGIISAVSGAPFTPLVGFDQSGIPSGGNIARTWRPAAHSRMRSQADISTRRAAASSATSTRRFSRCRRRARSAPASAGTRCAPRTADRRPRHQQEHRPGRRRVFSCAPRCSISSTA